MLDVLEKQLKILGDNTYGGFMTEKDKTRIADRQTLIIGIGGTGREALVTIKGRIKKQFVTAYENGIKADKPENVEYLLIDTDSRDANRSTDRLDNLVFSREVYVPQYTNMQTALQHKKMLDPHIQAFLNPNFVCDVGAGDGAGGFRQAGRLMWFSGLQNLRKAIEDKVNTLYKKANGRGIDVFVLTGLSGGTGGGCHIDTVYLIRDILKARGIEDRSKIFGYIFLPDVNINKEGVPEAAKKYMPANGYAHMKEIDYLMNVTKREDYFSEIYLKSSGGRSYDNLYTYIHVVSSEKTGGESATYSEVMDTVASSVINYLTVVDMANSMDDVSNDNRGIQSWAGFYINIGVMINRAESEDPNNVCRQYNAVGSSTCRIPIGEINAYIMSEFFSNIERIWDHAPDQTAVQGTSDRIGITGPMGIGGKLLSCIGMAFNPTDPQNDWRGVYKTRNINIAAAEERYLKNTQGKMENLAATLPGQIMNSFELTSESLMTDMNYGPLYAQRLCFSRSNICLISIIDARVKEIGDAYNSDNDFLSACEEAAEAAWGNIPNSPLHPRKEQLTDEFLNKRNELMRAKMIIQAHAIERNVLIALRGMILDYNNKIFDATVSVYEFLKDFFNRTQDNVMSQTSEHIDGTTYSWNVINTVQIAPSIKQFFKHDDKLNAEIQQFMLGILNDIKMMTKNIEEYDPESLVKFIGGFVENNLTQIRTNSLEQMILRAEYISRKDEKEGKKSIAEPVKADDTTLEQALGKLYNDLKSKSNPLFSLDAGAVAGVMGGGTGVGKRSSTRYALTVPMDQSCDNMFRILKEKIVSTDTAVMRSNRSDCIEMSQFEVCLAMYDYKNVKDYEKAYYKDLRPGTHLRENEEYVDTTSNSGEVGENWVKLPPLVPRETWRYDETYFISEIDALDTLIKNNFEIALEKGVIFHFDGQQEGQIYNQCETGKYYVKVTEPFSEANSKTVKDIFDESAESVIADCSDDSYKKKALVEKSKEVSGKAAEIEGNYKNGTPLHIKIDHTGDFIKLRGENIDEVKKYYISNYRAYAAVEREIKKLDSIRSLVDSIKQKAEYYKDEARKLGSAEEALRQQIDTFVKAIACNVIIKKGAFFGYTNASDEFVKILQHTSSVYKEYDLYNAYLSFEGKKMIDRAAESYYEKHNTEDGVFGPVVEPYISSADAMKEKAYLDDKDEIVKFYELFKECLNNYNF